MDIDDEWMSPPGSEDEDDNDGWMSPTGSEDEEDMLVALIVSHPNFPTLH